MPFRGRCANVDFWFALYRLLGDVRAGSSGDTAAVIAALRLEPTSLSIADTGSYRACFGGKSALSLTCQAHSNVSFSRHMGENLAL
jgi:hypothetical protein